MKISHLAKYRVFKKNSPMAYQNKINTRPWKQFQTLITNKTRIKWIIVKCYKFCSIWFPPCSIHKLQRLIKFNVTFLRTSGVLLIASISSIIRAWSRSLTAAYLFLLHNIYVSYMYIITLFNSVIYHCRRK